jgi:hypothetical protein
MSQIIVPVTQNPNQQCEWVVQPIQLHDDNVEVIWQLDELQQRYPGGTFWIKFTTSPSKDFDKGPFLGEILWQNQSNTLQVSGRVHDWGTYIYDIWVSCLGRNFTLNFPIDPQVDNLAPPPNSPVALPDRREEEEKEARDMETVETTVRCRP